VKSVVCFWVARSGEEEVVRLRRDVESGRVILGRTGRRAV